MLRLTINDKSHDVDIEPDVPLLWVSRDDRHDRNQIRLRHRVCGVCTVRIDGKAARSAYPVSEPPARRSPRSGLPRTAYSPRCNRLGRLDVPQCGYCQSGMIMAVSALLREKPKPTDAEIDSAITNICRCGTFQQVRAAIHAAANV